MAEIRTGDFDRLTRERTGYEKPDVKRPPDSEVPDFDRDVPDEYESTEERQRRERGNRGPLKEPGFGQGA